MWQYLCELWGPKIWPLIWICLSVQWLKCLPCEQLTVLIIVTLCKFFESGKCNYNGNNFLMENSLDVLHWREKQHDLKMYAKQIHSLTLLSLPRKAPLSHPSLLEQSTADPKPPEILVKTSTPWSARPRWPGVPSPGLPCSLSLQALRPRRSLHLNTA